MAIRTFSLAPDMERRCGSAAVTPCCTVRGEDKLCTTDAFGRRLPHLATMRNGAAICAENYTGCRSKTRLRSTCDTKNGPPSDAMIRGRGRVFGFRCSCVSPGFITYRATRCQTLSVAPGQIRPTRTARHSSSTSSPLATSVTSSCDQSLCALRGPSRRTRNPEAFT